jgi:hypothetical protein
MQGLQFGLSLAPIPGLAAIAIIVEQVSGQPFRGYSIQLTSYHPIRYTVSLRKFTFASQLTFHWSLIHLSTKSVALSFLSLG